MSTLTKAKKPTRKPLPPAKATCADLLRNLRDGTFDAAAAKGDWSIVERVVKARSTARRAA